MIKLLLATLIVPLAVLPAQRVTEGAPLVVTDTPLAPIQRVGQDTSVAASLNTVPGVTVQAQGRPVGQTDLSIRGSGFSGAGLSLAGLSLRNAQTEHFHAELPLPGWWLGEPDVLTGVSQAAQAEGHLTGTVSFFPLPVDPGSRVTAGVDNKSGYWVNADSQAVLRPESDMPVGIGVFAGRTEIPSVDFPDNDVDVTRGGARAQWTPHGGQADLLLGHREKTFGARGYYGVNDALDAEETTRDTLALASWRSTGPGQTGASLLLREFDDDYRLWLPDSLFRNQHTTRTAAAQAGHIFDLANNLRLRSRVAADIEDIDSTNLGDFERSRLAVTLLPEYRITDALSLQVGVRGELLEGDDNEALPLARLDLDLSDALHAFLEYSESVRRPSYTELNLESPGSLGNAGLEVQKQRAWETGIEWIPAARTTLRASLFHQRAEDTVDWIRPDAGATRFLAENIGRVDILGAEAVVIHRLADRLHTTFRYQWLDKDADNPPFASRYFLDYARNLVTLRVDWTPADWVRVEASQLWRDQVDNALRAAGGDQQWLTEIGLHLRHPDLSNVQWSLMASNALDDNYRVFPGQDTVAQRRVSAAVTVDW